ncbi:MAG: glycosyltransferase family 2 protein [Microcoleaceae cyanobacterium]
MIYWITVIYYSTALVEQLINSIPVINFQNRVIVVNNSLADHSISLLESEFVAVIHSPENLGFGRACNLGLQQAFQTDPQSIVWLINPDAYFREDSFQDYFSKKLLEQNPLKQNPLKQVEKFFTHYPEVSILGTVIRNHSGEPEFTGGEFDSQTGYIAASQELTHETSNNNIPPAYRLTHWVSGCSLLINLNNFQHCPQFDSRYFLYYEDFDFCQRYSQQGHTVVITDQIQVFHQTSSITNQNSSLKIQQSIYSYLLSLETHTPQTILLYRLCRIILASIIKITISPQTSFNKLRAILKYLNR